MCLAKKNGVANLMHLTRGTGLIQFDLQVVLKGLVVQ